MKPYSIFSALLMMISAAMNSCADDAFEFREHPLPGKKYFESTQSKQSITLQASGKRTHQNKSILTETSESVSAIGGGKDILLLIKYEHVATEEDIDGKRTVFDSNKADGNSHPPVFAEPMASLIGKEIKVVLNEKGDVVRIENYTDLIKGITSTLPEINIPKIVTEDTFAELRVGKGIEGAPGVMPGRLVKPGESWPLSKLRGGTNVRGTFTFKKMDVRDGARVAEIVFDGSVAKTSEGLDIMRAASPVLGKYLDKYGVKPEAGTLKGTLWFDGNLGITRESLVEKEMVISMKDDAGGKDESTTKETVHSKITKIEDLR